MTMGQRKLVPKLKTLRQRLRANSADELRLFPANCSRRLRRCICVPLRLQRKTLRRINLPRASMSRPDWLSACSRIAGRKKLNSGYYAACAGLQAQTQALEVIANNLANINTTGYRGQQPLFRSLLASSSGEFNDPLNQAINNFSALGGSRADLTPGNLQSTGNPLDLAVEGSGFFAIQTPAGTLYTRNGNFQ